MNAIDRLVLYQQSKKEEIGGQNKFEAYIGISSGYLSNMQKKGGAITSDVMIKVLDKFPLLNLDWIITGLGEMEKHPSEIVSEDNITLDINMDAKEVVIKALAEKIQRLESEIAELRRKYEPSEERPGA